MVSGQQIAALLAGELDLGLARPPFDQNTFASHLLQREALIVAVPAEHHLAGRERAVHPKDFANEPLIMYSPVEARYFYDLLVRLLPVREENVVHRVSQILTMLWLVASGRGIAFVPASAARLGIPGVRFLPLADLPPTPVELHLLWHRQARNPALRAILETLRQSRF